MADKMKAEPKETNVKKNWFKRHPILTVFLALFLIGLIFSSDNPQTSNSEEQKTRINQINTQQVTQEQVKQCIPNWNCDSWSDCNGGTQTRTCTDSNNCGIIKDKPIIQKSCVVEKAETSQRLTELSNSLKELKKNLEKQSNINKKIIQCTELCAGEDINIPYIKNTCRSDCYQIYYYAGEEALDKYIEELRG